LGQQVGVNREGMGVTPSWPMEANSGVRDRVRALQKALHVEFTTDRRSVHYMMIIFIIESYRKYRKKTRKKRKKK